MAVHVSQYRTYRWLDGITASTKDWEAIESVVESRGWMPLNRATSKILLVENTEGGLIGFMVFQLVPYVGPLYVEDAFRGQGTAEDLTERMLQFIESTDCRGFVVVAENQFSKRLCEANGMQLVRDPVYIKVGA